MTQIKLHNKRPASTPFLVRENSNDYAEINNSIHKSRRPELLKRISLERLMDLKVDYAFKQLFGNEKNKAITVVFLNAILQQTGRKPIKDISFSNIEIGGEYEGDKKSRLDLLVTTDDDEKINVEVQFTNEHDMIKRTLFYWSRVYTINQQKSMDYKELHPVITINILNFDLFPRTKRFHTTYHLLEDQDVFRLTDVMELHFIEMGKLIKAWKNSELDPWSDMLARWLLMLGMVDQRNSKVYDDIYHELEAIAMNDEMLRDAFHDWEELSMTQEQRLAYESRLKVILDQEDRENRKRELEAMEQSVAKKGQSVAKKEQDIAEKERDVAKKEQDIAEKERDVAKKEQDIAEKERDVAKKEQKLIQREQKVEQKEQLTALKLEETARKLLVKGMDIRSIAKATGVSQNRVVDINHNLQK
ncbi:Rpn family recombination-promoting nuclease/putative transposase [Lentibacillus sp. N15]|uniref:Rpn family recombination-promoting nuclease/putative transposase n=1 Tax=Lentibacillus songyuanensis TaxID=3136161 RepID=UPI0031BB00A6